MKRDIAKLRAEQERDEANVVAWIRDTSEEGLSLVWEAIQRTPVDAIDDVVLRMAQLGMTHAILLSASTKA